MKHFSFIMMLFLMGCAARPEYYSHSQHISLEGLPGYTNIFYKDNELAADPIKSDNPNLKSYTLSRSWNDQEFIIQKEGFKDYHLQLDSSLTSEPWATAEYLDDTRRYFPLPGLLVPIQTIQEVVSVPAYLGLSVLSLITFSPIDFVEYITKTGISLINIPKAVVSDVYNIISVPGTTIINPWTEFQYQSVIILEPTQELKEKCAQLDNTFISNNGCSMCTDSTIVLYASQEECDKCSNRYWEGGKCSLK